MLEQASPLKQSMLNSALQSQSRLRPNGNRFKKRLMASIMLTSLVDAFSILVIFLIMNHSSNQEALEFDNKGFELPRAEQAQVIQDGLVVRIENGRFTVGEQTVSLSQLAEAIQSQKADGKEKAGLIVVADRQLDFSDLSPVIAVASNSGFSKFKFVVERKE